MQQFSHLDSISHSWTKTFVKPATLLILASLESALNGEKESHFVGLASVFSQKTFLTTDTLLRHRFFSAASPMQSVGN